MTFGQKIFDLLLRTCAFVFVLVLLCFLVRVAFVVYIGHFHGALYEEGETLASLWPQIALMFYNGALFDHRGVGVFGVLYFVFGFLGVILRSAIPSFRLSLLNFYAYFIFALFLFVSIANFTYYTIYKDVFNVILLGIFFDDQRAILEDGLSGKYFLSVKILCFVFALWLCIKLYRFLLTKIAYCVDKFRQTIIVNAGLFVFLLVLMIFFINSEFSLGNRSLDRDLTPPSNVFLKKITPSPFRSLYQVYKGYRAGNEADFSSFTTKTFQQALSDFFGEDKHTLKESLSQTSLNQSSTLPVDHVFYIVAETLGEFAFDPQYDEIELLSGIKSLIDDQNGFRIDDFFESAHATIWSMESQIAGVYYTGVRLSFLSSTPLLTSVADNFKRAGFETYFYYGGSENWQNIGRFATSQGFDESFGVSKMEPFAKEHYPVPYRNVWGVWDNILLDFIAHQVQKSNKPTFNMVLTTTFHGPYDLPWRYIEEMGGKKERFESFIKEKKLAWDPLEIATLWWIDKHIARFVKNMAEKYPRSLFVITGDHSSIRSKNNQSFKEVGMVLYAPSLKLKKLTNSGAHLDISATLLALATPKNFEFFSFGKPLFSFVDSDFVLKNHKVMGFEVSGDQQRVYTQDGQLFDLLNGQIKTAPKSEEAKYYLQRLKDGKALSWYLFGKRNKEQFNNTKSLNETMSVAGLSADQQALLQNAQTPAERSRLFNLMTTGKALQGFGRYGQFNIGVSNKMDGVMGNVNSSLNVQGGYNVSMGSVSAATAYALGGTAGMRTAGMAESGWNFGTSTLENIASVLPQGRVARTMGNIGNTFGGGGGGGRVGEMSLEGLTMQGGQPLEMISGASNLTRDALLPSNASMSFTRSPSLHTNLLTNQAGGATFRTGGENSTFYQNHSLGTGGGGVGGGNGVGGLFTP